MPEPGTSSTETAAAAPRLPHSLTSLESVPFRWLVGSLLTFFLSMQAGFVVRSLLAWELTHSEMALAYVNLVIAVPMLIGSFVAGAVIDRFERRRIILISQVIVIGSELLVLALMITDQLEYWHLLATSFVMGVMYPFIMPTRTAMIAGMVGHNKISNAMALQTTAQNIARVVGPALVGSLIPFISLKGAFITSISLYVLSTLTAMKMPKSIPTRSGRSLLTDVAYSFTYIKKHRPMLMTVIFGLFPLLLTIPVFSMLVVFTREVWITGDAGLGYLTAMIGLGGITGSMFVARFGDHERRGRWMIVSALIFAVLLAAFSMSPSFSLALLLLLTANIFANVSVTQNQTIIQLLAHEEVRGRMSSLMMLSLGLTPLAVLPIAKASEIYGVAATIFTSCLILLVTMLLLYICSPSLRKLDMLIEKRRAEDAAGHAEDQQ